MIKEMKFPMRKKLSALLAAALAVSMLTLPAGAVSQSTALETVRALGIMAGDSQGNLNLSSAVTRAEFVTMMTAASSYKDTVGSGYGVSLFKDVKSSHWASEYIRLAVEQNWMTGYTDGTFRPGRTITLEEACTALLRLLGYDSSSLAGSFPTAQLSKAGSVGLLDDITAKQAQTQVACSDGTVRTFYHDGGAQSVGKLVSVTVTQSGTQLSAISKRSLSGTVNSAGTRFAGYSFADGVEILDTDGDGGYARIYPSRLAGYSLTDDDVLFYTLDSSGSIDCLILDEATGDTYTYAFVTQATSKTDGNNLSGSYTYLQNGQSHTVSGQQTYSVKVGGARLTFSDNGALKGMRQLSSVNLTGLTSLTATAGSSKYALAEDVMVLLRDSGQQGYYPTTLSAVNSTDYSLVGWYDNQGASAGGRIRILVATKK